MKKHLLFATAGLAGVVTLSGIEALSDEPRASSPATAAPDNTARNSVDRDRKTVTPEDQSNKKSDVDVTAQIRRAITSDKSLSTSARNVKIVTQGNTVALRGPVASAAEKSRIEALAKEHASGKQVRSELSIAD